MLLPTSASFWDFAPSPRSCGSGMGLLQLRQNQEVRFNSSWPTRAEARLSNRRHRSLCLSCFVLCVYVTTVTSLAAAPVRPVDLNPSQCQVSAELVPDVKTVANRTDSVLT